jgi:energy-coupling factor transporter ATP-binding protein EcfA2
MSVQARIYVACRELADCIVLHSRFGEALNGIQQLVTQADLSGLPFGATVVGESGSGKTTLMAALQRYIPAQDLLGERPSALCISAQSCPTIGDLLGKLIRLLGFPAAIRGNRISDQSLNLIAALKERCIKVLFIQDFQHLYRGERDKSAAGITDWLKQLVEDAGVVIVLFGTPELGDLGQLNAQLHSRSPARYRLAPFERNEEWVAFLQGMAQRCKAIDWTPIHQRYERELHIVSAGLLRPLKQVLSAAATVLIRDGGTELTPAVFGAAHQMVFGTDSATPNPFLGRRK